MGMVDLKPSGEMALSVCVAMIVLVTLAVALRVMVKVQSRAGLLFEDWLIILAACLFYTNNGLFLESVLGAGTDGTVELAEMGLPQLINFVKYLYIEEIIFVVGITTIKISILLFYRHVFSVQSFRRLVWILVALCVVWCLVTLFIVIFQCNAPVSAGWDVLVRGPGTKCIPPGDFVFGFELSNVIVDVLILCLPVYMVHHLQLPAQRRVAVSGIFLLGGFVCVTCMVRMYYIWDPASPDSSARSLPAAMDWTTVELASAIVCACLPTYAPLLKSASMLSASVRNWYSSVVGKSGESKSSSMASSKYMASYNHNHDGSRYDQLRDNGADRVRLTQATSGTKGSEAYPMKDVQLHKTVEVV